MSIFPGPDQPLLIFLLFESLATVGDICQHISALLDFVEGDIGGLQGHGVDAVNEVRVGDFW